MLPRRLCRPPSPAHEERRGGEKGEKAIVAVKTAPTETKTISILDRHKTKASDNRKITDQKNLSLRVTKIATCLF